MIACGEISKRSLSFDTNISTDHRETQNVSFSRATQRVEGHLDGGKPRGQPLCSPRPRCDEPRQPLGEDVAHALGVGAEKLQAAKSPHSVQIRNVFGHYSVRTARKLRAQPTLAATQEIS
jgi:hypothetical protein